MHKLFLFLFLPTLAQAQFTYVLDQSIGVYDQNEQALAQPWVGGINAAQYNTIDLNNDAKDDLVLFDRMANKVITFLNRDNTYSYAAEYENLFPDIVNWLLLRDFNCDGKKDLFTGDVLGIRVYKNVTSSGEALAWQQMLFYVPGGDAKSKVLLTQGSSGKINLQLQVDDLPAIADVDGDGDLDIFSMTFPGGSTVEFHQNLSQEDYNTCDSLAFKRQTQTWGKFAECYCGEFAFNNSNCPTSGGRVEHAGGKSLLSIDADGDSRQDLLLSEANCTRISFLKNEGDIANPVINTSADFPLSSPAIFPLFPAAYYEDLDFDGVKDIIATPNILQKSTSYNYNLDQSNWFYRNHGTDEKPQFILSKKNFLQESMLDAGDNAVPAFFDYDADGDLDLFVSQNNFPATILLYKNTGTPSLPTYELMEEDFLRLSFLSLHNMKIQFADINRDGKTDLTFSASNVVSGSTDLYYLANQNTAGLNFSGQSPQSIFQLSSSISESNVHVVDIDNDGAMDLLVGKSDGALEYHKNTGSGDTFNFILQDASYLDVAPSVVRRSTAVTTADLDGDDRTDLVMGNSNGVLSIISNFRESVYNPTTALTAITFNPRTAAYTAHNLGGKIWPVAANLFNTNKPAIVAGTSLGGLRLLRHDDDHSLGGDPVINIYPNPVARHQLLTVEIDRPAVMQIYSAVGHQVSEPFELRANEKNPIKLPYLSQGIYIARVIVNNKSFAKMFVVN